jgi:hypothetical protein
MYQVEISNRFVALENLDESLDINSAWESIRTKISRPQPKIIQDITG